MVKAACSSLDISVDNSNPMLLVIEKWDRLDVLAFDVFHNAYNPSTAHHVANIPVVLIDYGKNYSAIKAAGLDFQNKVNAAVARRMI